MTIEAVLPVYGPRHLARTRGAAVAVFHRGEGVAVALGAIASGALIGVSLFFVFGRVPAWMPLAVAVTAYATAMQLAGLSMRDVVRSHASWAIGLFAVHLLALAVWPAALALGQPLTWQIWLALPVALFAFALFLVVARAPASVIYRSGLHLALIAAIASYQWMWVLLNV